MEKQNLSEKIFDSKMKLLFKYFNHQLDAEVTELYWDKLKKYDDETFKRAVDYLVEQWTPGYNQPFPLLAVFSIAAKSILSKSNTRAIDRARIEEHDKVRNFSHDEEGLGHQLSVWTTYAEGWNEAQEKNKKVLDESFLLGGENGETISGSIPPGDTVGRGGRAPSEEED